MIGGELNKFKKFLKDSFQDGVVYRELRLSDEEVKLVKKIYSTSVLRKIASDKCADGKMWYGVSLEGVDR